MISCPPSTPPSTQHPGSAAAGLAFEGLRVLYEDRPALDGVSGTLPAGAVTVVVGPNGCGKSTLLRCLAGLVRPDAGEVLVGGDRVSALRPRELARRLAVLPQSPTAPPGLTVADLVARGRDPHRRWWDQWSARDEAVVEQVLERTGLTDLRDRALETLSGGQRQRAWIGMALAQQTPVLLLDEPTSYLDVAHQLDVLELVGSLAANDGTTVVAVLHDLGLAVRTADHIVALREGRVVIAGPTRDVVTESAVRTVFDVEARVLAADERGGPFVVPVRKAAEVNTCRRGRLRL